MRPIGLKGEPPENICQALNELNGGRLSNGQTVTLTTASATSVVKARGVAPQDCILLMPVTASAALEYGLGTTYILVANVIKDQFTITHPSNATADRTYRFVWFATQ